MFAMAAMRSFIRMATMAGSLEVREDDNECNKVQDNHGRLTIASTAIVATQSIMSEAIGASMSNVSKSDRGDNSVRGDHSGSISIATMASPTMVSKNGRSRRHL